MKGKQMTECFQVLAIISVIVIYYCVAGENSKNTTTIDSYHFKLSNASCHFGMVRSKNDSNCECPESDLANVFCDKYTKTIALAFCYCISYNEHFKTITVGYCVERCHVNINSPERCKGNLYSVIAKGENLTTVNDELCHGLKLNRTGQMCGSCLKGYAPAIYSYTRDCVRCNSTNMAYNLLKYVAMAYGPLTIFYFVIIIFRISISSGEFQGYILTTQFVTAPVIARFFTITEVNNVSNTATTKILAKILGSSYGMFNLDFFRFLYSSYCIHPSMTMMQTLVLDYAIAIYPLLLVIATYILVSLHGRYSLVVRLWKPFYKCFVKIRREWDLTVSLVEAFVTFILLCYVKILNTSVDLLTPVILYNVNGTTFSKLYLQYSGTVEYFGHDHIPYAVLAIIMMTIFNIVPLVLLCLYPSLWFQRCLNYFKIRRRILHAFMEVFYGCFKTTSQKYRYFAAFYLTIRYTNLIISMFVNGYSYMLAIGLVLLISAILIAAVQPHRNTMHSKIDALMMMCTGVSFIINSDYGTTKDIHYYHDHISNVPLNILIAVHFFYGVGLMISIFLPRGMVRALRAKIHTKFCNKAVVQADNKIETQPLLLGMTEGSDGSPSDIC